MNYKKIFSAVIVLIIFLSLIYIFSNQNSDKISECDVDFDCVQATCCHAASCVPKSNAPNCSRIFCTAECIPNTMDCMQGQCSCVNKKCEAIMNE